MEAKAAADREESRKRELAAAQLAEHRVSELTKTSQSDIIRLQQQHAALLQVEQAKAAALVNAANERAREVEAAATKRTQEIQAAAKESRLARPSSLFHSTKHMVNVIVRERSKVPLLRFACFYPRKCLAGFFRELLGVVLPSPWQLPGSLVFF